MRIFLPLLLLLVAFGTGASQTPGDVTKVPIAIPVHLSGNGTITLLDEPLGSVHDLTALRNRLQDIFAQRKRNGIYDPEEERHTSKGINLPLARKVIVQVEDHASFSDVLRVLRLVRDVDAKPVFLKVAATQGELMISIPVFADADELRLAPNPLTLLVKIDEKERLWLNRDSQASLPALLSRLQSVLQRRKELKAYRPGSTRVEATLFVKAHPSLPFSTVVDVFRQVDRVGANPLGLQIDDLEDFR